MEENKKKKGLRGIFNLFDLALIIIALLIGAVLFLSRDRDTSGALTGENQTRIQVRYTIELTGIQNGAASRIKPGAPVVDKIKKYSMGTVESVTVAPTVKEVSDETRDVLAAVEVPGQETATVVITAQAAETDTDIIVDGGYTIKVGLPVNVRIPGLNAQGYIVDIERGDVQ